MSQQNKQAIPGDSADKPSTSGKVPTPPARCANCGGPIQVGPKHSGCPVCDQWLNSRCPLCKGKLLHCDCHHPHTYE